jgi:hypothetical protein
VTVIEIDAKQYARIEIGGLFWILDSDIEEPLLFLPYGDLEMNGSL